VQNVLVCRAFGYSQVVHFSNNTVVPITKPTAGPDDFGLMHAGGLINRRTNFRHSQAHK